MEHDKSLEKNNKNEESKPAYANTFRLGFSETEINIDFGYRGNSEEVSIISNIAVPPKMMEDLIFGLISAAREYEKTFNADIGFADLFSEEDDE